MSIRWWSHVPSLHIASTRIRGALVMRGLRAQGVDVDWFDPLGPRPSVLVLGKRYDAASQALARRLQQQGTRVVLDLCDNRFAQDGASPLQAEASWQLVAAIAMADQVVASTPALAGLIAARATPGAPVLVIGDLADDLGVVPVNGLQRAWLRGRQALPRLRLARLRREGRQGLVWFGNHGGPYAEGGMSDLQLLREHIHAADARHPLFLTIISNSRDKYRALFRDWRLPTVYFDWHAASFDALLCAHRVALLPITANAFNDCKTDNRVVTALAAGLAVAADVIPSYQPYAAALGLGDWPALLPRLLGDAESRAASVRAGQAIARHHTDPARWLPLWRAALGLPTQTPEAMTR